MPLNLIKTYNELLELAALSEQQRNKSLRGIFDRDITNNPDFAFRQKKLNPTPADGQDSMDRLFTHLTTVVTDKATRKREYDRERSMRIHWIRYHVEENKKDNMLVFSVKEPEGVRTYIYDKNEKYVIVLEPLNHKNEYFLLTAYHLLGKDAARDKMVKKYKRKLNDLK